MARLSSSAILYLFCFLLIFINVLSETTPRSPKRARQPERPKYHAGDNVCGSQRRCCAGWTRPANATRCVIPVCSSGCGDRGKCMRPNLCLCPDGQMASTCTAPSSQSRSQVLGPRTRTHHPRSSSTKPPGREADDHSCSTRCLNGGTCTGFVCICLVGFRGPHCGQPVCSEPCRNGGKCLAPDQCLCPYGQDGPSCTGDGDGAATPGELPTGPCYTKVVGKACKNQLKNVHCTRALCCATVGRSWGRPCTPCPAQEACRRGYLLNPTLNVCVDVDECTQLPDICSNGNCINTLGSFSCHCFEGYSYNPSTLSCEDINECDMDPNLCGPGSICVNLPGSFRCQCGPGYVAINNDTKCVANKEGVCFNEYRNGECHSPRPQPLTHADCCCSGGKGWTEFRACQMCPPLRSVEYRELCASLTFRPPTTLGPDYIGKPRYSDGPVSYHTPGYPDGTEDRRLDLCADRGAELCPNGRCISNGVSYRCECNRGFELGTGGKCVDVNECSRQGICMNGRCMNTHGSYTCVCNPGYVLSDDGSVCRDVDECSENGKVCLGGHCINTQGSFRCVCNTGYQLSPTKTFCIDIDECRERPGLCQHGRCINNEGSFACLCNPGFEPSPDSGSCVDVNECIMEDEVCQRGVCTNVPGSYTCQCPPHLVLSSDGRSCQDVAKGICYSSYEAGVCTEPMTSPVTRVACCCSLVGRGGVVGGFGMPCKPCPLPGTQEYHTLCEGAPENLIPDVNECILKPNICQNGDCEDLPSGYRCICHTGYRSDPTRTLCIDIDECAQNGVICHGGLCINVPGSYHCTCPYGYHYDETTKSCQDIDECRETPSPCVNAICFNTPGSFICQCEEAGFSLDASERVCVDSRLGTCWASVREGRCEDQIRSSILKIECCSTVGVAWGSPCEMCPPLITVTITGTPTIGPDGKCPKGWLPHMADMCIDINECQLFTDLCSGGGTCLNTQGSFICQCPPGLTLDSTGRRCLDLRKAKCYAQYQWGRCESPYAGVFRKLICCCSVGSAWGDEEDCGPCPIPGSDAYKDLCLKGPGYGPSEPDDGSPFIDINECQLFPNLCGHGHCRNTAGSFVCICHQGYALDSTQTNCTDIDECRISPHICGKGRCENVPGSFICHCAPGYESPAVGQGCADIDECSRDRDLCKGGQCINTPGSFTCQCPDGHELTFDMKSCKDVDECSTDSGICSHGMCQNYMGGYECMCHHGFRPNMYKTSCLDVDECASSNGGCDSKCRNVPGSFECDCHDGFRLTPNRHTCEDINECDIRASVCDGGQCSNLPGKFQCECGDGFRQSEDKMSCIDIDECSENEGICIEGTCKNTPGSFRCECNPGYTTLPGKEGCHDCDECEVGSHDCDAEAECINTPGSYKCTCKEGFSGDGHYCTDINECVTNNGGCALNAMCINTKGGFECQCEEGFEEHGSHCIDINECDLEENLCINGFCSNLQGSYKCECDQGYEAVDDGKMCQDVDECSLPHVCRNGRCINNLGSFKCVCNPGFQLDSNNNCLDIDECENLDSCVHGTCTNTEGGYECTCPPDHQLNPTGNACIDKRIGQCFIKDGCINQIASRVTRAVCCCSAPGASWKLRMDCQQCPRNDTNEYLDLCPGSTGFTVDAINLSLEDINECEELDDFCIGGECSNLFGSYICNCPPGYKYNHENGHCEDTNECELPDACGEGGTCINTDGSHMCLCPDGYVLIGDKCTDTRQGTCYLATGSPDEPFDCTRPQSTFLTRKQCCCTLGKAWNALEDNIKGLPCTPCPPPTSEEYQKLCGPSGVLHPDGGMEMDMDECSLHGDLCQNGQCINTVGSFYCQCFQGYQYNELLHSCDDINECLGHPCPPNSECNNIPGSYRCVCNEGYQMSYTGRACEDIDECLTLGGACRNGRCENLVGSYRCICNNGFRQVRHECVDIDECAERPGICINGTCQNLIGSHTCKCAKGFELTDNNDCQDVDECSQMPGVCLHGRCKNDVGSFRCECQDGYVFNKDLLYCEDIDECAINGVCANGVCINTAGSFHCRCKDGFQISPDGRTCLDKDECASPETCRNGRCTNTEGSYHCVCETGFELSSDGKHCEDHRVGHCYEMFEHGVCSGVREGRLKKDQCCCTRGKAWTDLIVPCQACPTPDTEEFRTLCPRGFGFVKNGGNTFDDVNECEIHPGLCKNGRCINTDGSYRCQCLPGFKIDPSDSTQCIDVDECALHSHLCGRGNCTNVEGSFRCECEAGYMPNHDGICEDINECLEQTNLCAFRCQNTPGSFQCMCPRGFQLAHDMRHCKDIDECATGQHNCKEACKNTVGSFVCTCHHGYEEFGSECRDIDECSTDPTLCKPGECVNVPGSYHCRCPEGYKESTDLKHCIDVRMGACISSFQTGRCPPKSSESHRNLSTISQCCCGAGIAWGDDCKRCSRPKSVLHKKLCPHGPGFDSDGNDIDECEVTPDLCGNGECINTVGSYRCSCDAGFRLDDKKTKCEDVDECNATKLCQFECLNTMGSFVCSCPDGYVLGRNELQCLDVDECTSLRHGCGRNKCLNTMGGYECLCKEGTVKQGGQCVDVDECSQQPSPCAPPSTCSNKQGSYECKCPHGYDMTDDVCQKKSNQIVGSSSDCGNEVSCQFGCTRTPSGPRCNCPVGFKPYFWNQCIDDNECLQPGVCGEAMCQNAVGTFKCICAPGFIFNENTLTCIALLGGGCTGGSSCSYSCASTQLGSMCTCPQGFSKAGTDHCVSTGSTSTTTVTTPLKNLPHVPSSDIHRTPASERCVSCVQNDVHRSDGGYPNELLVKRGRRFRRSADEVPGLGLITVGKFTNESTAEDDFERMKRLSYQELMMNAAKEDGKSYDDSDPDGSYAVSGHWTVVRLLQNHLNSKDNQSTMVVYVNRKKVEDRDLALFSFLTTSNRFKNSEVCNASATLSTKGSERPIDFGKAESLLRLEERRHENGTGTWSLVCSGKTMGYEGVLAGKIDCYVPVPSRDSASRVDSSRDFFVSFSVPFKVLLI